MCYSSYGGNSGTWCILPAPGNPPYTDCAANPVYSSQTGNMNGVFYHDSHTRISDVTDGTSNTFLFSERARGILSTDPTSPGQGPGSNWQEWHWWTSGNYGDTMFDSKYPINAYKKMPDNTIYTIPGSYNNSTIWITAASSYHAGGANFTMCDGSVRFVKETVSSWPVNPTTTLPAAVTVSNSIFVLVPGQAMGVYQQLSTRAGQEVISSDAF